MKSSNSQLEITKSKIKEIARNEYGGESWNDDLDALTEAADIVADYSKATAQASEIPYRLAIKYLDQYGNSPHCIKCEYQQYPLSKHKAMDLVEKIDELEEAECNE